MVRRRRILNLAAASLLLVSGCATFWGGSGLDTYQEELRRLLDDLAGNFGEQVRLTSIARRIEIRSHGLVAEHREFVNTLNSLMSTRDVTEVQLRRSVETATVVGASGSGSTCCNCKTSCITSKQLMSGQRSSLF